jgi:hypothetical protein
MPPGTPKWGYYRMAVSWKNIMNNILKPQISVYNFLLLKKTFRKTGKVQVIKSKKLVKSIVGNEP